MSAPMMNLLRILQQIKLWSSYVPITSVVDETHGFHYEQGRAIIDFVDGTENPVGQEAVEWGVIGDEDPEFTNGSYAFAQKYEHDLDVWRALPTEMQEKFIGRRKFSDIELEDDEKIQQLTNVVAQDNRDDEEHKIVRMNVPFAQPGSRCTWYIFHRLCSLLGCN